MLDKTVLFVDDSPTMRRIIKNSLSRIGIENTVAAEMDPMLWKELMDRILD